MNPALSLFMAVGLGVVCFLALFTVTSARERKPRAAVISAIAVFVFAVVWMSGHLYFDLSAIVMFVLAQAVIIVALLFYLPLGKTSFVSIGGITEKVDERDVMFAREEYHPGTEKYDTYYARRPEFKVTDDKIRKLPRLLAPGGKYYDPVQSAYISAIFKILGRQCTKVDGPVNSTTIESDPCQMTEKIKKFARHLGADEIGIALLNPAYVYSHVGRGPEVWGSPIENNHRFAIVFSLEMDYEHVEQAPRPPITAESAREYLRGTFISVTLAQHIRNLGYPARAHVSDSNYQIMLPPVAHDAGLGELGRFGYLISPRFGARIRLGAITTDLPLITDKPIKFGVQEFCEICKRCAMNCPSASIPHGPKTSVRGVEKWPLEVESCTMYWRAIGTDCGLCMKVCPFSHPDNPVHNLVRAGISRSAVARRLSVWGEDIFYGKKAKF